MPLLCKELKGSSHFPCLPGLGGGVTGKEERFWSLAGERKPETRPELSQTHGDKLGETELGPAGVLASSSCRSVGVRKERLEHQ